MPTYRTHDITLEDRSAGTPKYGYMLWRADQRVRLWKVEDAQTIPSRVLSDAEYTQLLSLPQFEVPWFQENWQAGMGWVNHRIGFGQYGIAEGFKVDASSPSGIIQLARDTITSTVAGGNPSQYYPTGFAMVGSEVWAFIGRDTYQWSYANTRFDYVSEPETITDSAYRNGVEYEGNTYVPHWLEMDDPGNELPYHHIYKADADSGWTRSTLVPSAKYLVKADGKIWGGFIRDEADSTKDAITTALYKDKQTGSTTGNTTISTSTGLTIGSESNYVAIVAVMAIGNADNERIPSGVTVGGVACTQLGSSIIDTDHGLSIWYLKAPAQATATVTATFAAAFLAAVIHAASYYNVLQDAGADGTFGTVAQATGTSTSPSVAATTTPKGFVFAAMLNKVVTAVTPGTSETELSENSATSGASIVQGWTAWEFAIASGTTSVTIAPTLAASNFWRIAAVEVRGITIASGDTTIYLATDPTGSLAVNDEIRLDTAASPAANDELMLVLTLVVSPPSITVTRSYRGTTAVAYAGHFNIYKTTYNKHHIRPATDLTNTGAWGGATAIGTSDAEITGMVPYSDGQGSEFALVCKTDGLWTATGSGGVVPLYSMASQQDANNFREAHSWQNNERVILPLGGGGMLELYRGTIRDISFSRTMPDQTHLHGRVGAITSDPTRVFVLVQDTTTNTDRSTPGYHLMMGELVTIGSDTDYRWHHVGEYAYTTGSRVTQNALMACGVPSGATVHHRVWVGFSSTGSSELPRFHTLVNDAQVQYLATDDAYFVTVKDDRGHPNVNKRYGSVTFTVANLGTVATGNYWDVEYSIDGAAYAFITGTQATSRLSGTDASQTLSFSSELTGKVLQLRLSPKQGSVTTTTPQILDFRVSAALRPAPNKLHPIVLDLRERMHIRNGALDSPVSSGALAQLRTWNAQAAELILRDPSDTALNVLFLPGTYQEERMEISRYFIPAYKVSAVLLEV